MSRYKLVLGGTVAGIAGVLAFPTHSTKLTIPTSASSGTSNAAGTGSTSSTGGSGTTGTGATPGTGTSTGTGASSSTPSSSSGSSGSSSSSGSSAARTATSADAPFGYGDMTVKVTVTGSKITNVSIASLNDRGGRSAAIDNYAIPQLEQQVLAANSVNINGVSGATFTSQGFVNAVADALQKLGFK